MSVTTTTVVRCDVETCKREGLIDKKEKIQVIFTTEKTEGRSVKPYLEIFDLHICIACMERITSGNYLFGAGAQGYNRFAFKEGMYG